MEVKNLQEFIESFLKDVQKFVSYTCKNLLSSGENYGSVMLQIDIKLLNNKNEEEVIECAGKASPPRGFLWYVFNTKVTFKNEIAVYYTIVPALNEFGREKGVENLIDFIPEHYGARISLDPSSQVVDENALLLLKNLKTEGYDIGNRFIGFDLETSKLLLNDLATLHASVIAYKVEQPEKFQANILPYLDKHVMIENKELDALSRERLKKAFSKFPECIPHIPMTEALAANARNVMITPPKTNDIFTTLIHNDYWVNNTLLKYDNGKPIKNKMVDFQVIEQASLANDIVFFLYSSVELSVLEKHLDDLIKFYYQSFIGTLNKLQSDTSSYSFEALLEELSIIGREVQLMHILFMLTPIMTMKGKAKNLSDMKMIDIVVDESSLHENYYKKLRFTFMDFVKRGWI